MQNKNRVLIIDDNTALCHALVKYISRMGIDAEFAITLGNGLEKARAGSYDVIFLDVQLPDGCGMDAIGTLRDACFPPEIIIITGHGSEDAAEIAIQNEAWDYLQKGASFKEFKLSLGRAIQYRDQKKERIGHQVLKRDGIVGESPQIKTCLERLSQATYSDNAVLITGETGTGKEVFARAVHQNSKRAKGDFVIVDCAALPEHLVESVLFGHKKGAFTGADTNRDGLITQADGGTLFLDEIGELPFGLQKKFLRVLQEKRFRPVGGKKEIHSDFRLVSATHRNLLQMVEQKQFRQDLYFRIGSTPIDLPPLRERMGDIPVLVRHFQALNSRLPGERSHAVSPDFMETMEAYEWPGNVRELFNTLDYVYTRAIEEPLLFTRHLPINIRARAAKIKVKQTLNDTSPSVPETPTLLSLKEYLDEMRFRYVRDLMEITQGNVPTACRLSKLSRGHLYELLKKYKLR